MHASLGVLTQKVEAVEVADRQTTTVPTNEPERNKNTKPAQQSYASVTAKKGKSSNVAAKVTSATVWNEFQIVGEHILFQG